MRIALFEPDIPQNTGAILRLGACLGVQVDLIGPLGFVLDDRRLKRARLDYLTAADWRLHESWALFRAAHSGAGRLLLCDAGAGRSYLDCGYRPTDTLLFGPESAAVPQAVRAAADVALAIPMRPAARTLNLATAVAIVTGEALRQTDAFPRAG
jgi:tRNA (cytidine/uridine-2'-O-)-methyltransferase